MSDAASDLALFRVYPALAERLPRVRLGRWPTPVERWERLAARCGLTEVWAKREDRSHEIAGGNKIRGLELLLADARRRGATTLLTVGTTGSHHVCRTAVHGARLGFRVRALLLRQPHHSYVDANLRLAAEYGAGLVRVNPLTALPRFVGELISRPYFVGPGGTNPLACVGQVSAAFELAAQVRAGLLPEPDRLFVPLGSLGTAAGLLLGCKLAGLRTRVVGVVVSYRWYATARRVARLARRTLRLLRAADGAIPAVSIDATDLEVDAAALGDGYAVETEAAREATRALAECEGVAVDPTYGGKTLASLMARSRDSGPVLFWHTYHRVSEA